MQLRINLISIYLEWQVLTCSVCTLQYMMGIDTIFSQSVKWRNDDDEMAEDRYRTARGSRSKNRKSALFSLQYFEIPLGNVTMVYIYTADIQVMRATRWIVLRLLPEVHYKLSFFEGIVKSGKTVRQISRMIFKVAAPRREPGRVREYPGAFALRKFQWLLR